jgi:putative FmdB family regulatory protein
MPIYEYDCTSCGKNHEIMQKITEEPLKKCPDCGGKLKKKISNTSFVLKGTGWYATDYGTSGKTTEHKSPRKAEKTAEAKPAEKPAVEKSGAKEPVGSA